MSEPKKDEQPKTAIPDPQHHRLDPSGKEPTEVPDAKVHGVLPKPEAISANTDGMSGAQHAE